MAKFNKNINPVKLVKSNVDKSSPAVYTIGNTGNNLLWLKEAQMNKSIEVSTNIAALTSLDSFKVV